MEQRHNDQKAALAARKRSLDDREARLARRERELELMLTEAQKFKVLLLSSAAKLQRSPTVAKRAERFWEFIAPKDVEGVSFVRLGGSNDGGYVMLDDFARVQAAYGFGINNDVAWDKGMAERGIPVYMYDPSIAALPEEHSLFHFFAQGICGQGEEDDRFFTLENLLKRNGHEAFDNMVLKMDVEGAEWSSLQSVPAEHLARFRQIALEIHNLTDIGQSEEQGEKILAVLEKLHTSHQCVHIHANNNEAMPCLGGYPVPDCLEITYARRGDYRFLPCTRSFPTELDAPCTPRYAELIISRHIRSARP